MSIFSFILCSCLLLQNDNITTLYNNEILRGQVECIVNNGQLQSDSILFSYNKENRLTGYKIFNDGKANGYCVYKYRGENRIEQYHYDNNGKEERHCIIEFDDRENITMFREYGYIHPDTTIMTLLYLKCNTYDTENRIECAFEYFCDGSPSYRYQYSHDSDGTTTQTRINAVSGKTFTITRTAEDEYRNAVMVSETMPQDSPDWDSAKINYEYDNMGNWTKRKVNGSDPRLINAVTNATRKIYYVEK